VKKLFDAVQPHKAMFGQKDYQQVLMIQNMVHYFNLPIQIVTCPIIREADGLAMSSRNIHLSAADREHALVLSKALQYVKDHFEKKSFDALEEHATAMISNTPGVELDYFSIVDGTTLEKQNIKTAKNLVALVAAKVGHTRLIDNVLLS